jgi:hypothetical protein
MDERPRLTIRAFRPDDLRQIQPNEPGVDNTVELAGCVDNAWTVLQGGRPVAAGGLMFIHDYRALAWAFVSPDVPPLALARLARDHLDQQGYARMDAMVAQDYEQGHRWARLLGFHAEGPPMRYYLPNGGAAQMYVRFADDRP